MTLVYSLDSYKHYLFNYNEKIIKKAILFHFSLLHTIYIDINEYINGHIIIIIFVQFFNINVDLCQNIEIQSK